MWLDGPKSKFGSKKIPFLGLILWGITKLLQKINTDAQSLTCLLLCLAFVRVDKLPTYLCSQRYYSKDERTKDITEYILLAVTYRMDWLDTCKSISRVLLVATLRGQADLTLTRGLNKETTILDVCQTLLPRKAFSI